MLRVVIALILLVSPAAARDQTAEQFLHSIYDQYENDAGPSLDNEALKTYFTPELFALIKADADEANARGEVPKLDGDPLIDTQDWNITDLKFAVEEPRPGFATGVVTFRNFHRADEIRLDVVKLAGGWRIAEIYAPSGRLRELFGH